MRSHAERGLARLSAGFALTVALMLAIGTPQAARAIETTRGERVTAPQVEAAASALRADPRLHGGGKTERVLRFKPRDVEPEPPKAGYAGWRALIAWLSDATRALAWVLGALLLALVIVAWRRWLQVRADATPGGALVAPSHVRDLDIRPDSLPADIGHAARALWLRGEHRGALSLLYRGALSRLVHVHAVAIEAASTEGECARLARAALPADGGAYATRLIGTWQRAVYGGQTPPEAEVMALCDELDARLAAPAVVPIPAAPSAGAATA